MIANHLSVLFRLIPKANLAIIYMHFFISLFNKHPEFLLCSERGVTIKSYSLKTFPLKSTILSSDRFYDDVGRLAFLSLLSLLDTLYYAFLLGKWIFSFIFGVCAFQLERSLFDESWNANNIAQPLLILAKVSPFTWFNESTKQCLIRMV